MNSESLGRGIHVERETGIVNHWMFKGLVSETHRMLWKTANPIGISYTSTPSKIQHTDPSGKC